jgi:hypothetical protein
VIVAEQPGRGMKIGVSATLTTPATPCSDCCHGPIRFHAHVPGTEVSRNTRIATIAYPAGSESDLPVTILRPVGLLNSGKIRPDARSWSDVVRSSGRDECQARRAH